MTKRKRIELKEAIELLEKGEKIYYNLFSTVYLKLSPSDTVCCYYDSGEIKCYNTALSAQYYFKEEEPFSCDSIGWYRTKDGRKVVIIRDNGYGSVVGYIEHEAKERCWTYDGINVNRNASLQLVEKIEE